MTIPQKKKRFEGLIQFKDSLRLTLVCLQASLKEKFATAVQSPLIANLDAKQMDCHFLLFSKDKPVGPISTPQELNVGHILSRIYQLKGENLADEIFWYPDPTPLSIWIDPKDPLSTGYIYNIIAKLCIGPKPLDIRLCHGWGSFQAEKKEKDLSKIGNWLTQIKDDLYLDETRITLFSQVLARGWGQFSEVDSVHIASDGTYVSLTLCGRLHHPNQTPKILKELFLVPAHVVTINYGPKDQIDFCIPIRINQNAPLKGFIVIDQNRDEKMDQTG